MMYVTGVTREIPEQEYALGTEAMEFCGKQAGICYMKESYFDQSIAKSALSRFNKTVALGHHSIADHVKVTVYLENIPKVVAMILNSLQDYAASEKSGRYTKMSTEDKAQMFLYQKWQSIFFEEIQNQYPDLDSKHVEKLSMENARYMLSVFLPVSMSYTTSIRQWNYISDWIDHSRIHPPVDSPFYSRVGHELSRIQDEIKDRLYVEELRDNKDRRFGFMKPERDFGGKTQIVGDVYQVKYRGSFVQLAQAQRHRTLRYQMYFDGCATEFFVPYLLRNTRWEQEWITDLASLKDETPQATMIGIVESGHAEDFRLKAAERLCGRAQIEVMNQTLDTARQLHLPDLSGPGGIKAKCQLLKRCTEPCYFGAAGAFTRKI